MILVELVVDFEETPRIAKHVEHVPSTGDYVEVPPIVAPPDAPWMADQKEVRGIVRCVEWRNTSVRIHIDSHKALAQKRAAENDLKNGFDSLREMLAAIVDNSDHEGLPISLGVAEKNLARARQLLNSVQRLVKH